MLKKLKELNTDIQLFSVLDDEFDSFGSVLDIDTNEIVSIGEQFEIPDGIKYEPSVKEFEALAVSEQIKNKVFGTLPVQVGICCGKNRFLNATEWHTCSELNIAVTDLVLILAHRWDIKNNSIASSKFKAFYAPRGAAFEVYSTSLHFCPCQTSDSGFCSVVALPAGTNTQLEISGSDRLLVAKNKWLLVHDENLTKIRQGAVAGIHGKNTEIKY